MKIRCFFCIFILLSSFVACNPPDSEDQFPKPPREEDPPRRTGSTTTGGGTTGSTTDTDEDNEDHDGGTFGGTTSGGTTTGRSTTGGGTTTGGTSGGSSGGTTGGRVGCHSHVEFDKSLFAIWSRSDCMSIDLTRGSFSEGTFDASITSTQLGVCNCQVDAFGGEDQGELQISSCVHEDLETDCTSFNGRVSFETTDSSLNLICEKSYPACGTYH